MFSEKQNGLTNRSLDIGLGEFFRLTVKIKKPIDFIEFVEAIRASVF